MKSISILLVIVLLIIFCYILFPGYEVLDIYQLFLNFLAKLSEKASTIGDAFISLFEGDFKGFIASLGDAISIFSDEDKGFLESVEDGLIGIIKYIRDLFGVRSGAGGDF